MKPTAWALGDLDRFRGKRVLELGCRFGKMSCFFATCGAFVDGVDLQEPCIEIARREADKWRLSDQINFSTYSGNLNQLVGGYDFVFSKSVIVLMHDFGEVGRNIGGLLKPTGEYLGVENLAGGYALALTRKYIHRNWRGYHQRFTGMDNSTISELTAPFQEAEFRTFYGLVVAIRAKSPKAMCDD
ncbi:MAG: 3-demethylubiquinone-9 3-methyltransferase [Candidatus Angelobacter sp.]|nr:3-demethylubiquinone-9 3-methyltransferase [Candidatus Angelobacter sp.]